MRTLLTTALILTLSSIALGVDYRQSTAVNVKYGPFRSLSTGLTLTNSGFTIHYDHVLLSKNGGAYAAKHDANDPTYDSHGCWQIKLDTTDTNTRGSLDIMIDDANGVSPVKSVSITDPNYYAYKYTTGEVDIYSYRGYALMDSNAVKAAQHDQSEADGWTAARAVYLDTIYAWTAASTVQTKDVATRPTIVDMNTASTTWNLTATVDSNDVATTLLDTVIYGHKVSWYLYQLGIPIGRNGKGVQNPPE